MSWLSGSSYIYLTFYASKLFYNIRHMLWMTYLFALKNPNGSTVSKSSTVSLCSSTLELAILPIIDPYKFLSIIIRSSVLEPPWSCYGDEIYPFSLVFWLRFSGWATILSPTFRKSPILEPLLKEYPNSSSSFATI